MSPRTALVPILGIAAALLAAPASATALLQSNSAWQVTTTDPAGTDWNSSIGFVETGWQSATEIYDVVTVDPSLTQFAGSKGLWSSGGFASRSTEGRIWLRRVFELPALSAAALTLACDDDCVVWINGVEVINDDNGLAGYTSLKPGVNLLEQLRVGSNLIAMTVADEVWGVRSTWMHLEGTFAPSSGNEVPEPASLALLALGLAGVRVLRAQRRR